MEDKIHLRELYCALRRDLPEERRHEKSKKIAEALEVLDIFKKAGPILFYYSVREEVRTQELLLKYLSLKKLYLPKMVTPKHFEALRVKPPLRLKPGLMGVPEPEGGEKAETLDIILVPGVAFSPKGHRLGTGKGYYDRFLIQYPESFKIGLAYEEQMVENLPQDPYDIPVDVIVTDQNVYFCKKS